MSIVPPISSGVKMPPPYYQDELVTLYHGDSLDVMTELEAESVDVLLTDPPYFNVKDDDWDRQWAKREEFLTWLGEALDAATPALKASASVWVFASPALTSTIELEVIAPRFRVLNSIRWVKEHGWHQKADIDAQRRYLTAWEGVILAERLLDTYSRDSDALRKKMMWPVSNYLESARSDAGVDRRAIARALSDAGIYKNEQTGAAMCSDWEYGDSLPPQNAYAVLQATIGEGLGMPWGELRSLWGDLLADYYQARDRDLGPNRRPFNLNRAAGPVTDVWSFATVPPYAGKHPCEKPLSMLTHMIEATSRAGDLVLDPFAGSGSTLRAAKDLGRRAIGIEQDERYCEWIANRLAQDTLFGGVA